MSNYYMPDSLIPVPSTSHVTEERALFKNFSGCKIIWANPSPSLSLRVLTHKNEKVGFVSGTAKGTFHIPARAQGRAVQDKELGISSLVCFPDAAASWGPPRSLQLCDVRIPPQAQHPRPRESSGSSGRLQCTQAEESLSSKMTLRVGQQRS